MKHIGRGRFAEKRLPRCKCKQPEGKPGGVCKACRLAVLTALEKEDYRRAYPTSGRMLDGGGEALEEKPDDESERN